MRANINGISMHYKDLGSGQPIMLLHGFPLCHKMWQPQAEALVTAGNRVILPDLRGFGDSPVGSVPPSIGQLADDLIALLDYLKVEQTVIGGMSMGGYILLNLLSRYPQRVSAACFIVTRADGDDETAQAKRNHLLAEVNKGNPDAVADAFIQVLFAPAIHKEKPELITEVRNWMTSTSPEGLRFGLSAIRDRPDLTAMLPRLNLPSLVIGASEDKAIPPQKSQDIATGIPGARLQVVEGAGHMVNREREEEFNRLLLDFLATAVDDSR